MGQETGQIRKYRTCPYSFNSMTSYYSKCELNSMSNSLFIFSEINVTNNVFILKSPNIK